MQKAIYTTVGIEELLSHVQALKGVGARFVQMHAERNVDDGSYRLVYTFINVRAAQEQIAQDGSYAIENLVVEGIDQYQEIPSISSYYPAVFPFENEAHDLFGLAITDMQIDFKGFFYQVSTAEPMSVITPEVKAAREKAMKVRAAVVLTVGGEGALYRKGGVLLRQRAYPVKVVDTTAAGDTFTGYFLAGMIRGFDPGKCLRCASMAAALAVSREGASASIPTWREVLDFSAAQGEPLESLRGTGAAAL